MAAVLDILSWILLLTGGAFAIIGGVGLLRLPDLFCRMHGAGVTDTLGAGAILGGLMLVSWDSLITIKLVAVLVFLLFTSPTATHALARAAIAEGVEPWTGEQEEPSSND